MENRESVYLLAKKLGLTMDVWRGDVFVGRYRYSGDNLIKLKINDNQLRADYSGTNGGRVKFDTDSNSWIFPPYQRQPNKREQDSGADKREGK